MSKWIHRNALTLWVGITLSQTGSGWVEMTRMAPNSREQNAAIGKMFFFTLYAAFLVYVYVQRTDWPANRLKEKDAK